MYNKYLEDLGLTRDDYDYTTWTEGKKLKKIRKKTGLDFRACYNFDNTIAFYLYSMLKLYSKYTITALDYEKCQYGDFYGTLGEAIRQVRKGLKLYIKYGFSMISLTDKQKGKVAKYLGVSIDDLKEDALISVYKKAMHLYADIAPYIWD